MKFYPLALILGFAAMLANGAAYENIHIRSTFMAARTKARVEGRPLPNNEAGLARADSRANMLYGIGIALSLCSLASGIFAAIRHERGWYIALAALWLCDVMTLLII